MASTSEKTTDQSTEKPLENSAAVQNNEGKKNMHVALPRELIEKLKNKKDWGRYRRQWTYDEEKVRRVWEWQARMVFEELFDRVFSGDGEKVVGEDDVWGLQQIKEVLPTPPLEEKPKDN